MAHEEALPTRLPIFPAAPRAHITDAEIQTQR